MRQTKFFIVIVIILFLMFCRDALSYDYTWDDYRQPFSQLIRVPGFRSGSSTLYLDIPQNVINAYESLTLSLDIESNLIIKVGGLEQRTFERWSAYCSVNGAVLFGKHRIRVNDLPAKQTTSISINTKDLKAGQNTMTFSMSPTGSNVDWQEIPIAYGIHKLWFSEFSASPKELTEQLRDPRINKTKPYLLYIVEAVSASPVSSSGNRCGESTATLFIQGNVARAIGQSSWGDHFEASGIIDSNGQLKVGVASGKNVFATFTGVISGDSGNGIWQDQSQCYGTWTASRKVEQSQEEDSTDIETKLIGLKQLLEKGLISQEDYDRKKAELLDRF